MGCPWRRGYAGGLEVRPCGRLMQRQAANCQPLELRTTDMCLLSRTLEAVAQHSACTIWLAVK